MSNRTEAEVPGAAQPTYMDLLLRGEALMQDIDDFIDTWHDASDGTSIAALSLASFLGMTAEEYRLWVERPEALRYTAVAHKAEQPISTVLASRDRFGLAARASDRGEAESLLHWLIDCGRIKEPEAHW